MYNKSVGICLGVGDVVACLAVNDDGRWSWDMCTCKTMADVATIHHEGLLVNVVNENGGTERDIFQDVFQREGV